MNVSQINTAILNAAARGELTSEQLHQIGATLQIAQKELRRHAKKSLTVGQMVTWTSPSRGITLTGKVIKVGTRFVQVKTAEHGNWRVDAELLAR